MPLGAASFSLIRPGPGTGTVAWQHLPVARSRDSNPVSTCTDRHIPDRHGRIPVDSVGLMSEGSFVEC